MSSDIIDRIDDVITDWHGSVDSMRWTPEPQMGPVMFGLDAERVRLFNDQLVAILRPYVDALTLLASALRAAWEQAAPGVAAAARYLAARVPRRKDSRHRLLPRLAGPGVLPIDGHAYHRRRRQR